VSPRIHRIVNNLIELIYFYLVIKIQITYEWYTRKVKINYALNTTERECVVSIKHE